ncbi:MAG TPA: PASTA domain-containing protein [Iamia sp.]|nr:PASTA domain-containing protein [Iamia sp.]
MRKSSRRWSIAVVLVVALAVSGCGGGGDDEEPTGAGDETSTSMTEQPEDDTTTTSEEEEADAFMPDLLGLTEDEAREELGDLGIDDGIRITERESLEEAGTIIEQVPGSGQRITDDVDLIVAKPIGPVPDFVGLLISDVEEWAEERAIEVRVEEVLDDTLADGEVVATTPAADEDATSEILVQVARTPVIGSLAEIGVVGDDCSPNTGEVEVNGETFPNSLYYGAYESDCTAEYNLGRDWERFKATVGLSDDSESTAQVRFEVLVDGTSLFNEVLGLGATAEVDVDVSGGLRLVLRITSLDDYQDADGVWGDARLVGSPGAVDDEPVEGEDGTTTTTEP